MTTTPMPGLLTLDGRYFEPIGGTIHVVVSGYSGEFRIEGLWNGINPARKLLNRIALATDSVWIARGRFMDDLNTITAEVIE